MKKLQKHLNYSDMVLICNEINNKYIPTEVPFFEKVDKLFELEDLFGYAFIQYSYKELLKVVDSEINLIENNVDIAPTCQKGCANCCYFPIITTKLEAKLIVDTINTMSEPQKTFIYNHLKSYFNTYSNNLEDACSINFNEDQEFKYKYISKQLPCPLLNTHTNSCIAYDIRPIPCRSYLNYCNPIVCKDQLIPKEPFSYEFLREYYIEALNEIVQTIIYEENQDYGIQYPNDLIDVNYLPVLLKAELTKVKLK